MNDEGSELLNKVLDNLDGGGGGDNLSGIGGGAGSVNNSSGAGGGDESSMDLISQALKSSNNNNNNNNNNNIEGDEQAEKILENLLERQKAKKSLVQKILDQLTDPVMVCILFVIFQSTPVENVIFLAVSRVTTASAISVVAVKALLFAVIYYILTKVLLV